MRYPEGQEIRVGDLVWWDEGACVGHVQWIWDEERDGDYFWLGENLQGPPIWISNTHPYQSSNSFEGIPHDEASLADEGVGLLTEDEKHELRDAVTIAALRSKLGFEGKRYCVQTRAENCELIDWILSLKNEGVVLETIVVSREDIRDRSEQGVLPNGP
jgi:hypothetical protein